MKTTGFEGALCRELCLVVCEGTADKLGQENDFGWQTTTLLCSLTPGAPTCPLAPSSHVCEADLGTIALPYPQPSPCPTMPALLGLGVDFPTRAVGTRVSYTCARAGGAATDGCVF